MAKSPLAALLLVGSSFAQDVPPPSVFGLKLGAAVDVQQCKPGTSQPKTGMCIVIPDRQSLKTFSGEAKVFVACCDMPSWAPSHVLYVELVHGQIERVSLSTSGYAGQSSALADLKAKFGPPASTSPLAMQNGFGAKFNGLEAEWAAAWGRVRYTSMIEGTQSGFLVVETARGRDAYSDRLMRNVPKQRTL